MAKTTEKSETKNLYQRIISVMEEVKRLQKDKQVGSGSYAYKAISEEKVVTEVRAAMIRHGLVIFPIEQTHSLVDYMRPGRNGENTLVSLSTVDVRYKLVNVDTPSEFEIVVGSGTGTDPQDKGVGKAATYAMKYALLRTFMIPTGQDPDDIHNEELTAQQERAAAPKPVAAPSVQGSPSPAQSENMDVDITDKSQWQDVPGYEGKYYVSRAGRIYSVYNGGQLLTVSLSSYGYPTVGLLGQNSEQRNVLVHRIVAAVFIPNPENKPQVNHINGVKNDNRVDNLEWATSAENIRHAIDNGLNDQSGEGNSQAKLTNALAAEIKTRLANGDAPKVLAAEYGVSVSRISDIKNGHSWVAAAESGDAAAAPVQYATAAQKEQIIRLLNHPVITRPEKTKMLLNINRLDEERAVQAIAKLQKAISDRENGAVAPE